MGVFTEDEVSALALAARITGTLSFVATLTILGDHLYRRARGAPSTSSSRIIFWWTMCDLIATPLLVLGRDFVPATHEEIPSPWCQAQGFLMNYSYLASVFWAMFMAATSYMAVCWRWSLHDIVKAERWFHLISWVIPMILTLVPMFTATPERNALATGQPAPLWGDAIYYCWISDAWAQYRVYFFYNPVMICFFLNVVMYLLVVKEIWRVFQEANSMGKVSASPSARFHARYRFAIKCAMYLGVFVLVYGFALANRFESMLHPDDPMFALAMLHGILFPLKGTLNAVVYFASHIMARTGGVLYHSGDSTDGSSGRTGTGTASASASRSRAEFGLASRTGTVPITGSVTSQTPARPPASPAVVPRWPESDNKSAVAPPQVPAFEKPRPTYGAAPGGAQQGNGRGGAGGAPQRPVYF